MEKKNILFTRVYLDKNYDYIRENASNTSFRFTYFREGSYGLRFIKQNIPEIEILENPTFEEFKKKLKSKKYDIVGFSFYLYEVPRIIEMINYSRSIGVKTIWGGNYGVLTQGIEKYFDKLFIGYAEEEIARELKKEIKKIKHPLIIRHVGTPFGLQILRAGVIQTIRGCSFKCKFCQTNSFCKKVSTIPIESIDEVLREYKRRKIREIFITDENFGLIKDYSDKVVDLMEKYQLNWYAMSRGDIIEKNLEKWKEKGLIGVFIGLENFSQKNLDYMGKMISGEKIIELIEKLNNHNLLIIGFYMVGFEDETKESILKDIKKLKSLNLDVTQLCILTPFPYTPLWDYTEKKFGIWDKDYSHFDTKSLVWNHPKLKPKEMRLLLEKCFKIVSSRESFFNSFKKMYRKYTQIYGIREGLKYMYMGIINATFYRYFTKETEPFFFK